jgi:uncharacterized damage-inducible protein DinB
MDAVALVRRLHEHRSHLNRLLLDAVSGLSEEDLRRPFDIGQGSLWGTLTHLYGAEYVWLETLLGDDRAVLPGDRPGELPGSQKGEGGIGSLAELRSNWEALEARWFEYLGGLTPEVLDEGVYRVSTSSGHGRRLAVGRADVLLHLSLHAQYTTAQAVNMLKRLGVSPLPDVMLITLARSQHPENT